MAKVNVMIGFDCDRPRGNYANSEVGLEMAIIKQKSLIRLNDTLNKLNLSRTYFICGSFLEAMTGIFGKRIMKEVFSAGSPLSELADHTYSHNVLKFIPTRPDKIPVFPASLMEEYKKNSELFNQVFDTDLTNRGFRAPLGHFCGLLDEVEILETLKLSGVTYISSDLRDVNHSIAPKLYNESNLPRAPYFYENGLLELPGHGWHDTAFGNKSSTPLYETPPTEYDDILNYYLTLFSSAYKFSQESEQDFYCGLILHPYNNYFYDKDGLLFEDFVKRLNPECFRFINYGQARAEM